MDSPKKLPVDPSLENLRKQAKQLLRGYQDGSPEAVTRVGRVFIEKPVKLADAQHVVAVEYGFASWPKLIEYLTSIGAHSKAWKQDPNDNLPKAAHARDLDRFERILRTGEPTQHHLDAALALCWGPDKERDVSLDIARQLIDAGANPNGEFGGNYGAILMVPCESHNVMGMRFLLEHGAEAQTNPERKTIYYPSANTPMRVVLGTYTRGKPERRQAAVELLMEHGATRPAEVDEVAFAVFRNDPAALARLLDERPERIAKRFTGFPYGSMPLEGATYLHQAVEFEAPDCVDVLCARGYDHGIQINTAATPFRDADTGDMLGGQTPIFHSIVFNFGGNFPMFQHLLDKYGRWIDFKARATIRMHSWRTGKHETMRDLTPLEFAEANNNPDDTWWKTRDQELAILRERDVRSALENAVKRGDEAAAIALMDQHPEHVGPHLWPAAVHAAGSIVLTKALLDRGVDPDVCSAPRKALHLAASRGYVEIAELLLEHGADPDVLDGEHITPLELATGAISGERSRNVDALVGLLRAAGAAVTPFTAMLLGEDDEAIAAFEADPSLLEQTGWQHFPPLVCAARAGRPRVVDALLRLGADPEAGSDPDNSPLWFACQAVGNVPADQARIVTRLAAAGADVNRRCEEGTTALHFAVWRGHPAVVAALIEAGADPTIKDDQGQTPLDWLDRTQQAGSLDAIRTALGRSNPVL